MGELEHGDNLFGLFLCAHLETMATRGDVPDRQEAKFRLLANLVRREILDADFRRWYRLIDWIVKLPEDANRAVWLRLQGLKEVEALLRRPGVNGRCYQPQTARPFAGPEHPHQIDAGDGDIGDTLSFELGRRLEKGPPGTAAQIQPAHRAPLAAALQEEIERLATTAEASSCWSSRRGLIRSPGSRQRRMLGFLAGGKRDLWIVPRWVRGRKRILFQRNASAGGDVRLAAVPAEE
jgi:hypothetical protein